MHIGPGAASFGRNAATRGRRRDTELPLYLLALATDYDGTIAHHGSVDAPTLAALERLKQTGRRLILVTGRELADLKRVFPQVDLFDRIVAENGALLYEPASENERPLAPPPPAQFVEALKARHVTPLSVGRSIVATWEPNETAVLETIRDLGLELQITFNKGAVMVLQAGVNKASGLAAAVRELELSAVNVVGVGDAENDHAFLDICGCAAAVANALPTVKEHVDIRLDGDHGAGVIELIEMICRDDGGLVAPDRHGVLVGTDAEGRAIRLAPHAGGVLIAGSSGIGKSTLATALTEAMAEQQLEFCVFDPEGDYGELEHAISVGDAKGPPNMEEVVKLLRTLGANVVVNTQAMSVAERPEFFARLIPELSALRARTGRPHWLVVDEAHHLLAAERDDVAQVLPEKIHGALFITVHPDAMAPAALQNIEHVIALGADAAKTIAMFCSRIGAAPPAGIPAPGADEVVYWARHSGAAPIAVKPVRPKQSRRRHTRKYAEGDLGEDLSFYFRGPRGKLNLRAQNLALFAQIAEGVDADTWEHHRRSGDYSAWFGSVIKDDELAREAAAIEADTTLDANESRQRVLEAVSRRYTAPARASRS